MKLRDFIKALKYKDVAKALNTSTANVSRWAQGKAIPRPEMIEKIFSWSGGAVSAWDFYDDRKSDAGGD